MRAVFFNDSELFKKKGKAKKKSEKMLFLILFCSAVFGQYTLQYILLWKCHNQRG